jgi:HEAT repeat
MNKKNTPEKTRQRTLAFVAVFVGFLGTSIFAGINVFAAHQKNQDFSQLDAEEKFSRLPEYLLVDRKLLKDKDWSVRSSAAKALGDLQSKESISELILLLKEEFDFLEPKSAGCSVAKALGKLNAKEIVPQLVESFETVGSNDCILMALNEMLEQEKPSSLTELINSSIGTTQLKDKTLFNITESIDSYNNNKGIEFDIEKALSELEEMTENPEAILPLMVVLHDSLFRLNKQKQKITNKELFRNLRINGSSKKIFSYYTTTRPELNESGERGNIIPQLIESLQSSNSSVRYIAAHLLSRLKAKEAVPELTIVLNNSTRVEQYKMLETLIGLDGLNESHAKKWMFKMVEELERLDTFSDPERKSLAIDISTQIYLKFNQEHKVNSSVINQSRRMRDSQWTLTGFALAAFLFLLLLTLFCLKELQRITWKDHITCYFPEEVVSELSALRGELTQTKKSTLLVETTLLYVIFTLIWAFYIQINIDNLWLPSKDQRRR